MIKKDYLMRLIEQLTAVITQVTKLKSDNQVDEAIKLTNDTLHQLVGLSTDSIIQLETADLLVHLKLKDPIDWAEAAVFIAILLHQEGDLFEKRGQPNEHAARYLKALQLLLSATSSGEKVILPSYTPTPGDLAGKLTDIILPSETNAALLQHYEQTGQYALAEDSLFDWLELNPTVEVVEAGIAFYQRLQQKSDPELKAGSLPRDEVDAGLLELKTYLAE